MLDGLASGMLGLVVGAVLGLLLSALFDDLLVSCRRRVVHLGRYLIARRRAPLATDGFRLGPLVTTLCIVEGDGDQVINEQSCRVVVTHEEVHLPAEVAAWRREIEQDQDIRRVHGRQHHWNGLRYAVTGLTVSRTVIDECPEICLRLELADYYTFLAAQQLDRPMDDGTTLRSRYEQCSPEELPAFLCCSFGTNVAVVSADDRVVFARRSAAVGSRPGVWNASANEGLSRSLDSRGRTSPNLYDVARRGVAEELCIDRHEYRLELLAFAIDRRLNQWCALFVAFAHELTGQQILDRRARGIADKWENDRLEVERFDIEHVIKYLLRPDRRNAWAPAAPPLYYLALARRYGRAHLEHRTGRALRRLRPEAMA